MADYEDTIEMALNRVLELQERGVVTTGAGLLAQIAKLQASPKANGEQLRAFAAMARAIVPEDSLDVIESKLQLLAEGLPVSRHGQARAAGACPRGCGRPTMWVLELGREILRDAETDEMHYDSCPGREIGSDV